MIGGTCDYGTVSPFVIVSWTAGAPDGSTMGQSWPPRTRRRVLVSQTTGAIEIPGDLPGGTEVRVEYECRSDTQPSGTDLELPAFERPRRPVGPRTRVRWPAEVVLAPKRAGMRTAVAWRRGRVPRGASDRVLRCWGIARRR